MAAIFASGPGQVTAITDAGIPITTRIGLDGWTGAENMKAIITGLSVAAAGNQQFFQSLRNFIYIYSFGERIGELMVTGATFSGSCNFAESGFERVLGYYNQARFSRAGVPVSVAIGTTVRFPGFLTGGNFNLGDPISGIGQFALKFNVAPSEIG